MEREFKKWNTNHIQSYTIAPIFPEPPYVDYIALLNEAEKQQKKRFFMVSWLFDTLKNRSKKTKMEFKNGSVTFSTENANRLRSTPFPDFINDEILENEK